MKFESSPFKDKYTFVKKEFPFGNFYLCDQFYVSEIFEEVHFDWEKVVQVADVLVEFYGEHSHIAFISNRFNSYSIEPQSWIKFHQEYDFLIAGAVVAYNKINYLNASIEKQFSKFSLKRCSSLSEAFQWIVNLREFKQS